MTRYIFCYEEQFIVKEGNEEKRQDNYFIKNINTKYYFGEKAIKLQNIWPNLEKLHFNEVLRKATPLIEKRQILKIFFSHMIHQSEQNIIILPRDIIEIVRNELKDVVDEYSNQIILMGFGMLYSKTNVTLYKKEDIHDSYMIHVYQGPEGIEGILSKVNSNGEPLTITETYMEPSNQAIVMDKVIEHLSKQADSHSNILLFIKTRNELSKGFPYHDMLVNVDNDIFFNVDTIDPIEYSQPYNTGKFHFDNRLLLKQLTDRLTDEKYKALFSSIVNTFKRIAIEDQEFVLEQLMKVILRSHIISDHELKRLRDIFLNKVSSTYKVGFISPFSYGKSSLINGILGWPLLKSDIRAETAVVTHVSYADEYSLFFVKDEAIIAKRFDTFERFKEEVEIITSVHTASETLQHLYLTMPYDTRYPLIEWVDTPGLFAKHDYHNQITDDAIEDLDMVVFVFDPTKIGEKPYSKKINEYLEVIGEQNTIFAIGKRDSVIDSLELIEKELRQHLPGNLTEKDVVSVSGYFALRAKQYRKEQLELIDLQKDYLIYAQYEEGSYSGKRLDIHHIDKVYEMSNVGALERVIYKRVREWLKRRWTGESGIVS